MESSDSDGEEEDEEEDLLDNILVDFLGGFFVLFLEEGFLGSLSSSLELELELELSGSLSPPLPLPEPPLAATALLSSFNQALASSKLSKSPSDSNHVGTNGPGR